MRDDNRNMNPIDEEELDNLFTAKGNKLEKAIRKAKRHAIIRTAVICLIVVGIVGIASSIFLRELIYDMEGAVQIAEDLFNEVSSPNTYKGKVSRYHDNLSGRTIYTTYKIIEDKVVYTGEKEYFYGIFTQHYGNLIGIESPSIIGYSYDEEDLRQRRFNELGQREMVFFYPYVRYNTIFNDLALLEEIPEDKLMEFALSFDKAYTMDEVNRLIPKGITLSWYWVDDIREEEHAELQAIEKEQSHSDGEKYIMPYPAKVRSERTAYGIKSYNSHGQFYEQPEEVFFRAIEEGMKEKSRYQSEFKKLYQNLTAGKGNLRKEELKILGVVVTGDKESLKQLAGNSAIRASSLGVVTDKY